MKERSVQSAKASLRDAGLISQISRGGGPRNHRVTSRWEMKFAPREDPPECFISDGYSLKEEPPEELPQGCASVLDTPLDGNEEENSRKNALELPHMVAEKEKKKEEHERVTAA